MNKVSAEEIVKIARKLNKEGKIWHFHLLAPGCALNENKKFALILENSADGEQFINLSFASQKQTGQILVKMLHGEQILKKNVKIGTLQGLEPKEKKMVEKALELNNKGLAWHHHLLYPECIFSHDSRYYTLMFEDTLTGAVIKNMTKKEPKKALKKIEPLFYSRKNG